MGYHFYKSLAVLVCLFLLPFTTLATNPEISNWIKNLSEGAPETATGFADMDAEVKVSGNTIHVVWITRDGSGIEYLYYRRSMDNGLTWMPKILLFQDDDIEATSFDNTQQKLHVSGDYVHIAIAHYLDEGGWHGALTYLRSTDGGATFSDPEVIYESATYFKVLQVMIGGLGANVQIGFLQVINYAPEQKIFLLSSIDNGDNFSQTEAIVNPAGKITLISDFKTTGENVYFLYNEATDPWYNYDYKTHILYSNNWGGSFEDVVISVPRADGTNHHTNGLQDYNYTSKMAVDGDRLWVIWTGLNELDAQTVFVRSSMDGGNTFAQVRQISGTITSFQSGLETIAAKGDHVYATFITPQGATYLCKSDDGGQSFTEPDLISPAGSNDIGGTWWANMVMDVNGINAHYIANHGVYGHFTPLDETSYLVYTANWNYRDTHRPKIIVGENGLLHTVHQAGGLLFQTGGFSDSDIMYRRMNPDFFEMGTTDNALDMRIDPNPGGNSSEYRFDNMTIASSNSLDFSAAMTIEIWVKPAIGAPMEQRILKKHTNFSAFGDYGDFQLRTRDDWGKRQPVCVINTTSGPYALWGSKGLKDGFWNHIAITYSNDSSTDNFKLYLNGEIIAAETTAGDILLPKALWKLGCYDDSNIYQGFNGSVDELRFWNIARTTEDLKSSKYLPLQGDETGLAAYYNFNVISDEGQVCDITGKGNHGYLMYKEELIPSTLADPDPKFSFVQQVSEFYFTQLTEDGTGAEWDFGDGNTSELINPSHIYSSPGNYEVCMTTYAGENIGLACEMVTVEGIEKIWPTIGGNTSGVTTLIYGGNLSPDFDYLLTKDGVQDILAFRTDAAGLNMISAEFDLTDQPLGTYSLVVDNGSTTFELPDAFEIVVGQQSEPWVDLGGPNVVLVNRWTTFTISYGNSSNVDAYAVPVWIAISDVEDIEIAFLDFNISMPDYIIENGYEGIDTIGLEVPMDHFQGEPKPMKVFPLMIPHIPAGYSNTVRIRVKSPVDYELNVWNDKPYFQSPLNTELAACLVSVFTEAFVQATGEAVPGLGCLISIGTELFEVHKPHRPLTKPDFWSQTFTWSAVLLDCGINLSGVGALTKAMWSIFGNMPIYAKNLSDCYRAFGDPNIKNKVIPTVNSLDPNEKYGPQGFTEDNYIAETRQMSYQISFENMDSATAPAQEVWIIDTLASDLYDLSRFSFGTVGFGDSIFFLNPGSYEFGLETDLRPGKNAIVRIEGQLDVETRLLTFHFLTLDPETGDLTEDAFGGFLPPNVNAPEGEGFVTFTIGVQDNLLHNDFVENEASIFFDANPAIVTNNYLNTFDLILPESEVAIENPIATDTTFLVNVSGTDDGSGIRYYQIYVSENGGDYLLSSIEYAETFYFTGTFGSSYQFYSIAVDSVGNMETAPLVPDAEVSVVTGVNNIRDNLAGFKVTPVPAGDYLHIEFQLGETTEIQGSIMEVTGKTVLVLFEGLFSEGKHTIRENIDLMPGVYLVTLQSESGQTARRIIVE